MKIITVRGAKDSGKTTLIRYVFDNLRRDGAKILFYKVESYLQDDFCATILWRGLKIYICSRGDKNDDKNDDKNGDKMRWVKDGVEGAGEAHADVLINALTNSLNKDEYETIVDSKTLDFIDLKKVGDGEAMTKQRQRKYFEEILPKLLDLLQN